MLIYSVQSTVTYLNIIYRFILQSELNYCVLQSSKQAIIRQLVNTAMFPFSNQEDDDANTPFFEDNTEETSIFNNDTQQEFSAFHLFNSSSNNQFDSNCFGTIEETKQPKQKRGSSRKSLIMELDEFDRNQSFNDIEKKYKQEESDNRQSDYNNPKFINFREFDTNNSKNQLQESRVERFDHHHLHVSTNYQLSSNQSQRFNKPSFNTEPKNGLNKSKQKQLNFAFSFKNTKNKNEPTQLNIHVGENVNSKTNMNQKQLANDNLKQSQQFDRNNQFKKQRQRENPSQVVSIPQEEYSFRGNFNQNKSYKPNFIFSKKNNTQINFETKTNQQLIRLAQQKNQKSSQLKSSKFNFLASTLAPKHNNEALLSSKAGLMQQKSYKQIQKNQLRKKNQTSEAKQQKNKPISSKFQFGNFNNILRKSQVKQIQETVGDDKKIQKLLSETNKIDDQKKQTQTHNSNSNETQIKSDKLIDAKEPIKNQFKQKIIQKGRYQQLAHRLLKNKIQDNFNFPEKQKKTNITQQKQESKTDFNPRPKQKPCFNLKLIKQPFKYQQNVGNIARKEREKQKKIQYTKVVKQQIRKRDDIATTKFLKQDIISKGFTFPNQKTSTEKQEKIMQNQQPLDTQNKTPKIMKIQVKKNKQMLNRQTQKFIKSSQLEQQNAINICEQDKQKADEQTTKKIREHLIDYEKYEDEMYLLSQEIEQTKKKYASCEDGYKDIFLLLSKANLILSGRFMSQIQSNQEKERG